MRRCEGNQRRTGLVRRFPGGVLPVQPARVIGSGFPNAVIGGKKLAINQNYELPE
jgi:hypothetical protein